MSEKNQSKSLGKSLVAGGLAILSTIYLLNPGAGFFGDIIPDNLPFLGNLDEAAAAAMLLSCLSYFGLDLKRLFGRGGDSPSSSHSQGAKPVPGRVVEEE